MSSFEYEPTSTNLNDQLTSADLHQLRIHMDAAGYDPQLFDTLTGLVPDRPIGATVLDDLMLQEELDLQ